VAEFGVTGGRCPVRGGGVTRITVPTSVSVSFDSSKISITDRAGETLTRLTVRENNTVTLTNSRNERASVAIDNTNRPFHAQYDCVIRDDEGVAVYFAPEIRFTSQNIPPLGSATFTALEGGLTLMFPANEALSHENETRPALTFFNLNINQSLTLANIGEKPYEARLVTDTVFIYDFVIRDDKGFVINQNTNERTTRIIFPTDNALHITPRSQNEMFFPSDWLDEISIVLGGELTKGLYELEPGESLLVTNSSLDTTHDIRIANKQNFRDFTYDFLMEDGQDIRYGTKRRDGVIALPPGVILTITAGEDETIEVRLPSANVITARETDVQAVDSYLLEPGESALLTNHGENEFRINPISDATFGHMDFVRKDDEGEITDFNRIPFNQMFALEAGHSILLTNTAHNPVEFLYPYTWLHEGLVIEYSETEALRYTLTEENQTMHVVNKDRLYVFGLKAEGENSPSVFDYVMTDARGLVTEYGVFFGGEIFVPANGRLAIMPQRGTTMALFYPAEWEGLIFTQSTSEAAPLYRATYKPGDRFTLVNRTRDRNAMTFDIQNNSMNTAAAFFIREGRDNARITADEIPSGGMITIPENTSFTFTVAAGADLEIWFPQEWVRHLIR
jgi:hypothetical protein